MLIKIGEFKEQKDGSALVTVDYDKDFSNLVKKIYKKKRATKKLMERAILDGLKNYIKLQEKFNE